MKNYVYVDTDGYIIGSCSTPDIPDPLTGLTIQESPTFISVSSIKPGYRIRASDLELADVQTLEECKSIKRNELVTSWNIEKAEGVTINNKVAPTDADSWTRYLAIKAMSSDGDWINVPIPLMDGTFEIMTQAKMNILWTALKSMERNLLNKLRSRIELVNAATTKEEVYNVYW